jgi:hypothetical protein
MTADDTEPVVRVSKSFIENLYQVASKNEVEKVCKLLSMWRQAENPTSFY